MRSRTSLAGLISGGLLALILTATVAAYAGQVAATVEVSAPSGAQTCGVPITLTAVIQDIDGKPIEGQLVTWSFQSGNITGDQILRTTSTTNASGIATTRIQLACTAHSVTVQATADEASGTVLAISSGKGLPRTDTLDGGTSTTLAVVLAGFAVLLGSGMIVRRFAVTRR